MDPDDELQPQPMSFEHYLRLDAEHPRPVEYVAGVAYPKYGRSMRHNRITMNIGLALHDRACENMCHVSMSLMRVHVTVDTICYPDIVVTCDAEDNDEWTIFRPCLIVEVASPESASIDRGAKREVYTAIPSLRTYLVVSEQRPFIQRWWRDDLSDVWRAEIISEGIVPLLGPDVEITTEEIYRDVPPIEEE